MADIAVIGDVSDINCWSNIPYYFFQAGKEVALFENPWKLDLETFRNSRKVWNLKNLLAFNKPGGYQFSAEFLARAEASIAPAYFKNTIISFNQLFPRASTVARAGGKIYYYIDMTLTDLFNDPSYQINIGNLIKEKALDQEKENYARAEKVISMGTWTQTSLHTHYGLPSDKLGTILPGANISGKETRTIKPFSAGAGISRDLVLGFVGKDWKRKGLGILIDVKNVLQARGYKIKVKIIGNCPEEWRTTPGVEFIGFIDKQNESPRFIEELSSCDIGCLFSKGEALGISILEFLYLGIPVAGFYHQGLQDTLMQGASLRFNIHDSITEIANSFHKYILEQEFQLFLKENALACADQVTWAHCVENWKRILH